MPSNFIYREDKVKKHLAVLVARFSSVVALTLPSVTSAQPPIHDPGTGAGSPTIEKRFSIPSPRGATTTAVVFTDPRNQRRKIVMFEPFLERTDGALYGAALESLWNIYGKNRGLFQLAEAKTALEASFGGNSICWPVYNPNQSFCVFPVKDSQSGKIASLTVWLK